MRKERLIFLMVYNLIRIVMLKAARRQNVNVNRISFADALAWLRHGDLGTWPDLKINPLRPGLITTAGDAFWYLIMPIRLAG